jgi:hypothetical protein
MRALVKVGLAAGAVAVGIGAWAVVWGPRESAPPLVFVPSEQLTGLSGGHDVVHALQTIVETSADPFVFSLPRAEPGKGPEDEAAAFLRDLDAADLSALAKLQLQRKWALAESPEARAEARALLSGAPSR